MFHSVGNPAFWRLLCEAIIGGSTVRHITMAASVEGNVCYMYGHPCQSESYIVIHDIDCKILCPYIIILHFEA